MLDTLHKLGESPEEKADRIKADNDKYVFNEIKCLKERVSKLEEEKKIKEVEGWDGEFRVGETYQGKDTGVVVKCLGIGKYSSTFYGVVIIANKRYSIGHAQHYWTKDQFTPYTLPNKGEVV